MGIIVENVSKSFEGRKVLDDISLEIKDGDFVTLLAPTGEGKTTLLRIIAGVEKPDQGKIYYDGKDVTKVSVQKRRISFVYQWFVNYPSMTAYENIAIPLEASPEKLSKAEIDKRVRKTAQLLKIDRFLNQRPSELSGGQQQRLAIARAIVKEAAYIFLDEPLTNLDYKLQEELRIELKNIFSERGHGAVLFATPQPIEALSLSTHVGFLNKGRLMQYGPVRMVYHQPMYKEVGAYFSHPAMNLFDCNVVEESGHLWLKATDQLKVPVDPFREILTNGHYLLGIRAHALRTEKLSEDMIPITAEVELGEVVGSDTELHLNHEGISFISLLQGMGSFEIGQEVTAYLYPDRFFIFDKGSGELIAQTHETIEWHPS